METFLAGERPSLVGFDGGPKDRALGAVDGSAREREHAVLRKEQTLHVCAPNESIKMKF